MSKGKFVVFEGMDGSGKTTIIKRLKEYLESENRLDDFVFTREPGSSHSKEAEEIRQLILDNDNSFSVMVDALLFAASRRLNLENAFGQDWKRIKRLFQIGIEPHHLFIKEF